MQNAKEYLKDSTTIKPILWDSANETVRVIDQRLLPLEEKIIEIKTHEEMAEAIRNMTVRGAPLIGISAAFGMALAAKNGADFCEADKLLCSTRPTAVNLMWALDTMQAVLKSCTLDDSQTIYKKLLAKANWILEDDIERCMKMSKHAAEYIKQNIIQTESNPSSRGGQSPTSRSIPSPNWIATPSSRARNDDETLRPISLLTHCNAGALATGGYGTALGVIRTLAQENLVEMVYVDETRPRQQGARLTAWELAHDGIPATLISDNMAAHIMKTRSVDLVVTGADRITANGDAANKIGTYGLAIIAKHHNVPFFIAAPESTIDRSLDHGDLIPIEERSHDEVSIINGEYCTVKSGISVTNPAFDVTPRELIERIFTENGEF